MDKIEICGKCAFEFGNEPLFLKCQKEVGLDQNFTSTNPFSHKEIKFFKKGEIIIQQGAKFSGVYCIKSGNVKIVRLKESNNEFLLWFAMPGEIIGLDSFINNENHTSSAIAVDECTTCFIPEEDFKNLLKDYPEASLELIKVLCNKIDYIEGRITSIVCKKSSSRLAEQLLHMALKKNPDKNGIIEIKYNTEELANMVGTTKNYIYKLLTKLSKKGLISIKFHRIRILDLDQLFMQATGDTVKTSA